MESDLKTAEGQLGEAGLAWRVTPYKPRTALGRKIVALRAELAACGFKFQSLEELEAELADGRERFNGKS
jgi:hypothetical protein